MGLFRAGGVTVEPGMTASQNPSTAGSNRALIDTWYSRMWNRWDKSVFPDLLCRDISLRGSLGIAVQGYDGVSSYMDQIRAAFPDFRNSVEEVISEGPAAFARLTYTGTHRGEVLGLAPTGRRISYAGAAVFRFREGKISQVWVLGDLYNLARQLQ
jgi:steroid delta-isomerase-like uncharacterized protein